MEILDSAIKQGIAPAIIVAVYLIIVKIIDNKRNSQQVKLNKTLLDSINNLNNFVISITENILNKDKDKCRSAIKNSIYASCMRIIKFVSETLVNNHIESNKENILFNINKLISAEYYNVYSNLSMYIIDDYRVSELLKKEWMEEVEASIVDIIYNSPLSKEDKITSFNNKINILFESYITYIINNSVKE